MNDLLLAATASNKTFEGIVYIIVDLLNAIIPITVAACLFVFFWGVLDIFLHSDNAEKLRDGRGRIFWSMVALFVVVSLGGILQILKATLEGK